MALSDSIQTASNFIAGEESFSASAYWDVNGYAIGYGNHYYQDGSAVGSSDTIDEPTALTLLNYYVAQNAAAIQAQILVPLTDNQLAALTSLRYNCGTITVTLLNLINSGADPATVAAQIQQTCTTSGGVTDQDLILRRQAEAGLYQQAGLSGTSLLIGASLVIGAILLLK